MSSKRSKNYSRFTRKFNKPFEVFIGCIKRVLIRRCKRTPCSHIAAAQMGDTADYLAITQSLSLPLLPTHTTACDRHTLIERKKEREKERKKERKKDYTPIRFSQVN